MNAAVELEEPLKEVVASVGKGLEASIKQVVSIAHSIIGQYLEILLIRVEVQKLTEEQSIVKLVATVFGIEVMPLKLELVIGLKLIAAVVAA